MEFGVREHPPGQIFIPGLPCLYRWRPCRPCPLLGMDVVVVDVFLEVFLEVVFYVESVGVFPSQGVLHHTHHRHHRHRHYLWSP